LKIGKIAPTNAALNALSKPAASSVSIPNFEQLAGGDQPSAMRFE
jgi:hypothetical protein